MGEGVSIGLPVRNGADYLRRCLNSIINQTYTNLEIIIGDNASDDDTEKICREFAEKDNRITYYRHTRNRGAAYNYNFVFHKSRFPYFKWQSHDDWLDPNFIEKCMEVLDNTGDEVSLVYPLWFIIDEHDEVQAREGTDIKWRGKYPFQRVEDLVNDRQHSLLNRCNPVYGVIRRSKMEKTGLIRSYQSSDEVFLIELALMGDFRQVPEYLLYRRYHPKMSLRANLSAEDRINWFYPESGKSYPMPQTRVVFGYSLAVLFSRLPLLDRLQGLYVILKWLKLGMWRNVGGEFKIKLREFFGLLPRKI